ncbi:hypothetical protein T484DRAFT_1646401, partial [Baffinella frigidus]
TLHPTPYTLHPTPYTLHLRPYTLHPTPFYASINRKRHPTSFDGQARLLTLSRSWRVGS